MILVVDIGNSRLKWATSEAGRLSDMHAVAWTESRMESLCESEWTALARIESAWVVNVAGTANERIVTDVLQRRFGIMPDIVRSTAELGGIRNTYEAPERLGADRLVAMVAAYHRYHAGVCVIDCGTAITIDLVDDEGVFRGGVIAPGTGLMRATLARRTHALPVSSAMMGGSACARSTEEGIAAGCLLAASGLIDRAHGEFAKALGLPPRCILTGGEAPQILPMLSFPCDHDPGLVLRGLAILAGNRA